MPGESKDFLRGFASNLRRLIAERSLSVTEVAERANVKVGHIEAALEAREDLGALEIIRLAAALGATPQDLFEGLGLGDEDDRSGG